MTDADNGAPRSKWRTVSRETEGAPPPPEVAYRVFGPALDRARVYADLLATQGVARGLIGPREVGRLWERHLLNCAVVEEAFLPDSVVYDVGSGAGLPGVVLALVRPDLRITLVEPLLRRARFLQEAVTVLDLSTVTVLRSRAEDLAGQVSADAATARAVAPLQKLATWSLPLVRPGGLLVAIKGETAETELEQAEEQLRRLGARRWSVEQFGVGLIDPPTRAVVIEAGRPMRHPGDTKARVTRDKRRR